MNYIITSDDSPDIFVENTKRVVVSPDSEEPKTVVVEDNSFSVIAIGTQGPVGPEGPTGSSTIPDPIDVLSFNLSADVSVSQGELAWNADEETLDLGQNGAVLQLGQELHWHVRNGHTGEIPNGTPVMAIGTLGASSRIIVAPMDGTDPENAKYLLGITTEDIEDGGDGKVSHIGKVRGIDTSAWEEGDVLWISDQTPGVLTNVRPEGLGLPIAFVVNKHAHQGALAVRATTLDELLYVKRNSAIEAAVYTVATLPSAIKAGKIIYISDEAGGPTLAFSDGTNWRRTSDNSIVS